MFTIQREIQLEGRGIHTGRKTRLKIFPKDSMGILFSPLPVPPACACPHADRCPARPAGARHPVSIPVEPGSLRGGGRYTGLGKGRVELKTVEHFLSACFALRVFGLKVQFSGEEMPIGDGSALFYAELLQQAGLKRIGSLPELELKEPLGVKRERALILAFPARSLRVLFFLYPPLPSLQPQILDFSFSKKSYLREIAPARTFCTYGEVRELRRAGLGGGGDRSNTVVLTKKGALDPLRFPDEPVRHKVLDFLGDLAFLPFFPKAFFLCVGSGHALNHELVKRIARTIRA